MRRAIVWTVVAGAVAVLAFAPFRDGNGGPRPAGDAPLGASVTTPGDSASSAGSPNPTGVDTGPAAGALRPDRSSPAPPASSSAPATAPATTAPPAPTLPEPTEAELAVLGPLIAAMDAGQRAGTPLVLGIATAVVASSLPGDDSVPPEARPVVQALAQLIATPGTQVNEVTGQNSLALAQLDRALGELAFANPALNEAIHQTAATLATMGRSATPVSPPGGVFLEDLAVLLGYFVVE